MVIVYDSLLKANNTTIRRRRSKRKENKRKWFWRKCKCDTFFEILIVDR